MDYLKRIIELGVLVEPESVEKLKSLSPDDIEIIVEKVEHNRPLVLSNEVIEQYLKKTKILLLKDFKEKRSYSR